MESVPGVIAWTILTVSPMTWPTLIAFVLLWGSAAGIGAQAFYALWTTELFPTRYLLLTLYLRINLVYYPQNGYSFEGILSVLICSHSP